MLYVLNQKSNFTKEEILDYRQKLEMFPHHPNVIFAPSTCFLPFFEGYQLASQDISPYQKGAYTGEENAESLKSLGVSYAIVGHSERRAYFQEQNDLLAKKMAACIKASITPILCIGETKEAYEQGKTMDMLKKELAVLNFFPQEMWKKVIIAYEPIWAIGTGKVPEKRDIQKIINWIKEDTKTRVLYGGSVTINSLKELSTVSNLDGFLIGGMSLKIEEVGKLLQQL